MKNFISGGGKWIVEAPYVLDAAKQLHVNMAWCVQIYDGPSQRKGQGPGGVFNPTAFIPHPRGYHHGVAAGQDIALRSASLLTSSHVI